MYKLNKYFIAIFLLLTFTQGISMRLWMHHWFHERGSSKTATLPSSNEVKIKCDCLQDASMPLQDAVSFELAIPSRKHSPQYGIADVRFCSSDKIFCSLKGPPQVFSF